MILKKWVIRTLTLSFVFLLLVSILPSPAVSAIGPDEVMKRKILIHKSLLKIYRAQNRVEEALKEFPVVLSLLPHNAGLHYDFGIYLLRAGKKEAALKQLKQAVSLDRTNPDYLGGLGTALVRMKRYEEGCKYLRDAIRYGGAKYKKTYDEAVKFIKYQRKMEQYKKQQKELQKRQEQRRKQIEDREDEDDDW